MYSGGFYSFPSQEEFWAYWSRYIFINRYQNAPKSVHEVLLELVRDKDYFVITTNVDHCFRKAGFDKKHLFYTQGDYGLFQCSEPCCQETFDNEKTVRAMVEAQGFTVADGVLTPPTDGTPTMAVPSELPSGLPALRQTDDDEPALRRQICRGRGLARRGGAVRKFPPHAGRTKDPLFRARRRLQHAGVPFFAHRKQENENIEKTAYFRTFANSYHKLSGKAVRVMFGFRNFGKTNTSNGIEKLCSALEEADAVIIGAGAGLSTSAGFVYTGERFEKHFHDFAEKYHFSDMYSGGFYPFDTLEEYWVYWSRYIWINRYTPAPKPVYEDLLGLVKNKDYFVLTTNVDHQFQNAGFDKHRLFYTQGDYGLFQCNKPCCQKTYDNEATIRQMVEQQKGMRVPTELVPHCPLCGKPMTMNLRCDDTFVQDEGWYSASERYTDFLRRHKGLKVLFLELGAGMNTPTIIKFSFWRMVNEWKNATYACINLGEAYAPREIQANSICINEDIGNVLKQL